MNPLTQIRNTQKASKFEVSQGLSEDASWHARYKHSAYVFAGGLPYDLTEGDVLAIFAQYGELIDVNLVKDKDTGKPRGFAFVAYEDQRSTTLAVDNLSGARITGRIIRVEHVDSYKRKKAEVEGRQPSPDSDEDAAQPRLPHPREGSREADRRSRGPSGGQHMPPGTSDGTAPWMNSNSIVSMLAEGAAPRATTQPGVPVQDVSKPHKASKSSKHKKQHNVSKKKSKDKKAERSSRQVSPYRGG